VIGAAVVRRLPVQPPRDGRGDHRARATVVLFIGWRRPPRQRAPDGPRNANAASGTS